MRYPRTRHCNRPRFDVLDDRDLPSATVSVTSGTLKIVSNQSSDHVSLQDTHKGGNAYVRVIVNGDFAHPIDKLASKITKRTVQFTGKGGNDVFENDTKSLKVIFDGGPGNDVCFGSNSADVLKGGEGNDRLVAEGGNDVLDGGDGNDQLSSGDGIDRIMAGNGNDQIVEPSTVDMVDSGPGSDAWVYNNVLVQRPDLLNTTEAGAAASFTYRFRTTPQRPVAVSVKSMDNTEGKITLEPSARRVTIRGLDDTEVDGRRRFIVHLIFKSADPNFNFTTPIKIAAFNNDNDTEYSLSDGKYAGTFEGTITTPRFESRYMSGIVELSVKKGILVATKPGPGNGRVSSTGNVTLEVRPTPSVFSGLQLPEGVTLSNLVLQFKRTDSSEGTWKLRGKLSIPFFGTDDLAGEGTWTVRKA